MSVTYGDTLICIKDIDENLHEGDIVTVSGLRANGEYVTLREVSKWMPYRTDNFVVIREPWWAWTPQARAEWRGKLRDVLPQVLVGLRESGVIK